MTADPAPCRLAAVRFACVFEKTRPGAADVYFYRKIPTVTYVMPVFFVSVSLLVLTFVVMPVSLSAGFGADAVRRTGYVRVSLFFLPVFRADVRLDSAFGNLLVTHGKKTDEIHLNADKTDERSIVRLIRRPMLSCLRVRRLVLDARVGFRDNAAATTYTLTVLRAAFGAVSAFFRSREDITVLGRFVPAYTADTLEADAFGIISLSIANIIYSLFAALRQRSKTAK